MSQTPDFRQHVMHGLIPQIRQERTSMRQLLQHSVRDFSQQALRLVFTAPHLLAQQSGSPVMVRGFTYGFVEGDALIGLPPCQSMAESLSHAIADLEDYFYQQFWREHRMLSKDYVTPQERTILTFTHLHWTRPAIAQHLSIVKRTVDTHFTNAYFTLGVSKERDALDACQELGLFLYLT